VRVPPATSKAERSISSSEQLEGVRMSAACAGVANPSDPLANPATVK
jgi:hypothetical protein